MLNSAVVFVPLVDGFCAHAPESVQTMPLKSVMPSRVFRIRHNGMVWQCPPQPATWRFPNEIGTVLKKK
jgi:hypothetical protein